MTEITNLSIVILIIVDLDGSKNMWMKLDTHCECFGVCVCSLCGWVDKSMFVSINGNDHDDDVHDDDDERTGKTAPISQRNNFWVEKTLSLNFKRPLPKTKLSHSLFLHIWTWKMIVTLLLLVCYNSCRLNRCRPWTDWKSSEQFKSVWFFSGVYLFLS